VAFEQAESPLEEVKAALQAVGDPFIRRNLLFYLASNWFYTYDFNGFNGQQFNVRTRGLNSAVFWGAQMLAAWLFGQLLDARARPPLRAWRGMLCVAVSLAASLSLALWSNVQGVCNGGRGWDRAMPCKLDCVRDFPQVLVPMLVYALLGAADAVYQNFAYWLMSMTAGSDVRKTVMYSAVYKGTQSLGAGLAWLVDGPGVVSYRAQGAAALALALVACVPVLPTFRALDYEKPASA